VSGGKTWPGGEPATLCGDRPGETTWDTPGQLQVTYVQGESISVDFALTENHLGRVNMLLCPLDAKPGDGSCKKMQR
jgi:hypothetical protein